MKKSIAWLLVTIMMWGMVPPINLYAYNGPYYRQAPVSDLTIRNLPANASANNYSFELDWTQPGNYTRDTTAIGGPEFAQRFDVHYRNATARETTSRQLGQPIDTSGTTPNEPFNRVVNNLSMDVNSLYEFKVNPVRFNIYQVPDNASPSGYRLETRQATMDTANTPPERKALYLTNMTVTATGAGTELTVVWTNPTLDGRDVFEGYSIYYQENDGSGREIGGAPIIVNMNDRNLIRNRDGTLEYTFNDPGNIFPGRLYSVKVEPRYAGANLRAYATSNNPTAEPQQIMVNGQNYSITYKPSNQVEYRYDRAYVRPRLTLIEDGLEFVRLYWGTMANIYTGFDIEELVIYSSDNPPEGNIDETSEHPDMPQAKWLATLRGSELEQTHYFRTPHGNSVKYYQIIIFFVNRDNNNQRIFMKTEVEMFDPVFSDFKPYKPTIYKVQPMIDTRIDLEVTWLAFLRAPYTEQEKKEVTSAYHGTDMYLDRNVLYDIYITDDINNLNEGLFNSTFVNFPVNPTPLLGSNLNPVIPFPDPDNPNVSFPTYRRSFSIYYTFDEVSGTYVSKPIEENKTYFIRVVATRVPPQGRPEVSDPADASVFVPPSGPVTTEPLMLTAPPLRVKETKENSFTVEWPNRFLEVYRPDSGWVGNIYPDMPQWFEPDSWYAVVGVHPDDGRMIFGRSSVDIESLEGGTREHWFALNEVINYSQLISMDLDDLEGVDTFLKNAKNALTDRLIKMGAKASTIPNELPLRIIDLSTANFETHTVEYERVTTDGDYHSYMNTINNASTGWTRPAPGFSFNNGYSTCVITTANNPGGTLKTNTTYLVFVRPYEGNRNAYYPAYVIDTTLDPKPPLDIDPNTPVLFRDKVTDFSVRVYWEYIEGLEYDIRYSDRMLDYAAGGTLVPWANIIAQINSNPRENKIERDGKVYVYYTINNLFPDTDYHIWIKARNPNTGKESPSWSNPITMRTLDIQTPNPPNIVPATSYYMGEYNKQNATNYSGIEENAFNLMWQIVAGDSPPLATGGTATGGTAASLNLDELIPALLHIVRFSDLIANREYYIRGKTVLTVVKEANANRRTYNYVIQVSLNADYSDPIEFIIPAMVDVSGMNTANYRRKESEWFELRLFTRRSPDDEGGEIDPRLYPMPDKDWDLTYDNATETLKYRFRSNQMGSDGKFDQQADQRFISRLIASRTMVFNIDLSYYNDQPITMREVEMPFSVLSAFSERKITLEIKADDYTFSVPPGAFDTAAVRALPLGVGSSINITMNNAPQGLPLLPEGQSFSAEPQRVNVRIGTEERNVRLSTFNKPMTVAVSGEGHSTPFGFNASLFMNNANTGGWQNMGGSYNATNKTFKANLPIAGTVGAVTRTTPEALFEADPSIDAMQRVTNIISITDMLDYNGAERVTANRFNNIVAAFANNRSTVEMNGTVSSTDLNSLTRAKLAVSGTVTRDKAISSLVSLYELKTKRVVRPMTTAAEVPGIEAADAALRTNLLKAVDIGFIEGDLRPTDTLSMADFMIMLDIIMQDAGM